MPSTTEPNAKISILPAKKEQTKKKTSRKGAAKRTKDPRPSLESQNRQLPHKIPNQPHPPSAEVKPMNPSTKIKPTTTLS